MESRIPRSKYTVGDRIEFQISPEKVEVGTIESVSWDTDEYSLLYLISEIGPRMRSNNIYQRSEEFILGHSLAALSMAIA